MSYIYNKIILYFCIKCLNYKLISNKSVNFSYDS